MIDTLPTSFTTIPLLLRNTTTAITLKTKTSWYPHPSTHSIKYSEDAVLVLCLRVSHAMLSLLMFKVCTSVDSMKGKLIIPSRLLIIDATHHPPTPSTSPPLDTSESHTLVR